MSTLKRSIEYMKKHSFDEVYVVRIIELWPTITHFGLDGDGGADYFLVNLRRRLFAKQDIDVDKILYEMLNGDDDNTLSLRHLESIDVIKSIRSGDYDKLYKIIPTRYYTNLELYKILNITNYQLTSRPVISKLILNKNNTRNATHYYKGEDIIDNMHELVSKNIDEICFKNKVYISQVRTMELLGVCHQYMTLSIKLDGGLFGVPLPIGGVDLGNGGTRFYYLKDDILKCLSNKKLYMKSRSFIGSRNATRRVKTQTTMLLHFMGLNIDELRRTYIKKSLAIQILEMDKFCAGVSGDELIDKALDAMSKRPNKTTIEFSRFKYILSTKFQTMCGGGNVLGYVFDIDKITSTNRIPVTIAIKILKIFKERRRRHGGELS